VRKRESKNKIGPVKLRLLQLTNLRNNFYNYLEVKELKIN